MGIEALQKILLESNNIVFFGGAGVSTESNIPDFRSEKGIYNTEKKYGKSPEIMLSATFFKKHTEEFYKFYRDQMIYEEAKPNQAHIVLAKLEQEGKLKAVVTQNIDGLHQIAGSKEVLELHGSIYRNYCTNCYQTYGLEDIVNSKSVVPKCQKCGGILKPDVVLYEEGLNMEVVKRAINYIASADVLIIGGTSLAVYPAASLVEYYSGDKLVLINKSKTPYDHRANLVIYDSIGKVLGKAWG